MKQNGKASLWVLMAVLFITALCTSNMPSLGAKALIRAEWLEQEGKQWRMGLFCMQPGVSADAAEAEMEMALYIGTGKTLSDAVAAAEAALPGEAEYKLCDTVVVGGEMPQSTLQTLANEIERNGIGRLAARILYTPNRLGDAENNEIDASALYASAEEFEENAPRLYQVQSEVLLPAARLDTEAGSLTAAGGVLLDTTGEIPFTDTEIAAVRLLQNGYGTLERTVLGQRVTIKALIGVDTSAGQSVFRVDGLVTGLPTQKKAKDALLAEISRQLENELEAVRTAGVVTGADFAHEAAFAAVRSRNESILAGQKPCIWQVHLIAGK